MNRKSTKTGVDVSPRRVGLKGEIERLANQIIASLGEQSIAEIYRQQVRADRTRRYELPSPARKGQPQVEIMHTLLGIELKIGRRRLTCPDLSTARYLSVFLRLGVAAVALPYDITRLARLADDLESSWFRMMMLADNETVGMDPRLSTRLIRRLIELQREEVAIMGPGPIAPRFNR